MTLHNRQKNSVLFNTDKQGAKGDLQYGRQNALLGAAILWMLIAMALGGDLDLSEDMIVIVVLAVVGLLFLVPGVLIIRYGIKRSRMGEDAWIQETAQTSGYQESIIRDFANQVLEDGSFRLQFGTAGGKGFLTRDYIFFYGMLVKIEDIIGAYFVETSYTANINGKVKKCT